MKMKFTSLLLLAGVVFSSKAQVMIQENFTSPFSAANAGWIRTNNSASPNAFWAQGQGTVFPAFNGAANDYYAVSYLSSASSTPTTLSNWLITPTVTLKNGGVIEFATRTTTNPANFPDRLEVYMSQGTGANVGNTPTSLGTFSTLLVSVNPGLTTTGYPGAWTVYSATITGLGSPVAGRLGFRYYVTNAGPSSTAVNSFYIGLDAVRYFNPCGAVVPSYTICSGGSATLNTTGAVTPATYTWSPASSNNTSVVVTPGSTSVYTLNYEESGAPCPAVTSTVTIGGQLSVSITASSNSVCAGTTVSLSAISAASNYSWNTGSVAPSMTVAPSTTTTYSVGVMNGLCFGANIITINTIPLPTVTALSNSTLLCTSGPSTSVTFTGNGASNYIWVLGSSSASGNSITLNIPSPTPSVTTTQSLGLIGIDANGCVGTFIYTLTISPQPTLTATSNKTVVCKNESVQLTASGASTYSWSGAATSTANPFNASVGGSTGNKQYVVVGTSSAGCSATAAAVSVSVSACDGIAEVGSYADAAIFPNPFTNEIRITSFEGSATVYNAIGQAVVSSKVNGEASLQTDELPKGVYFVKIYSNEGGLVKTSKLIKN